MTNKYKVILIFDDNKRVELFQVKATSSEEAVRNGFDDFCYYYEHYSQKDLSELKLDISKSSVWEME